MSLKASDQNLAAKRFKKVYLEISNICNLKCSFCPAVERGEMQISEQHFTERLLKVSPWAERVCLHVMGEPLAHPLLQRFIEIAEQHKVDLEITTNGTLLNLTTTQALLNSTVKQVNFSLQSFLDNFPEASPEKYIEKILNFVEQAFVKRPDLYTNLRLWGHGSEGFENDTEMVLQKVERRFAVVINRNVDVGFKKSKNVKNRLYIHFDSRFNWPDLRRPVLSEKGSCYGLRSHVAVLSDGAVVPCCLDKEAGMQLGSIDHQDLLQIIDSPKAKNIRKGFEQGLLQEELCRRCGYATRFKKHKTVQGADVAPKLYINI